MASRTSLSKRAPPSSSSSSSSDTPQPIPPLMDMSRTTAQYAHLMNINATLVGLINTPAVPSTCDQRLNLAFSILQAIITGTECLGFLSKPYVETLFKTGEIALCEIEASVGNILSKAPPGRNRLQRRSANVKSGAGGCIAKPRKVDFDRMLRGMPTASSSSANSVTTKQLLLTPISLSTYNDNDSSSSIDASLTIRKTLILTTLTRLLHLPPHTHDSSLLSLALTTLSLCTGANFTVSDLSFSSNTSPNTSPSTTTTESTTSTTTTPSTSSFLQPTNPKTHPSLPLPTISEHEKEHLFTHAMLVLMDLAACLSRRFWGWEVKIRKQVVPGTGDQRWARAGMWVTAGQEEGVVGEVRRVLDEERLGMVLGGEGEQSREGSGSASEEEGK